MRHAHVHARTRAVDEVDANLVAHLDDHRVRHARAAVLDAVDGERPDLGRRELVRHLGHVLVDVDLEVLDRTRGDRGQLGVDTLERLELHALRLDGGRGGREGAGSLGAVRGGAGVAVVREQAARREQHHEEDAGHDRHDPGHQPGVAKPPAAARGAEQPFGLGGCAVGLGLVSFE